MMLLSTACLALLGFRKAEAPTQKTHSKSSASSQAVADSINAFAFRLLNKIGTSNNKNVLISPYSVSTAMSMVAPGLVGKDQGSLLTSLAPGLKLGQIEDGSAALSHSLLSVSGQPLQIANSAWLFKKLKPNPVFAAHLQQSFQADLHAFVPDKTSVQQMNSWVDEKTKHRINKVIDSLCPAIRLVLINAIAFDGKWQHQFDPKETRKQDFHKLSGATASVPMMHLKAAIAYANNATLRAIRLEYQGGDFSMVLMLPEKGRDAGALLRSLNPSSVSALLGHMSSEGDLPVTVPKFKFSDQYQLEGPLSQMGMASLFKNADFSGISPQFGDGAIDQVIHKTFIKVDEEGTKAAAVTGVMVRTLAIRMKAPEFVADRPFAFLIIHNSTRTILFAGVVNDPKM